MRSSWIGVCPKSNDKCLQIVFAGVEVLSAACVLQNRPLDSGAREASLMQQLSRRKCSE